MSRIKGHGRLRASAAMITLATALSVTTLVGMASAATSSVSDSVGPTDTDFETTLEVPQFDPAGGILTAVTVELVAGVHGDMMVENLSTTSAGSGAVTLAADLSVGLEADPTVGVSPAFPTVTQEFTLGVCDTEDPSTVTGCDETPDFAGTAGLTVNGLETTETTTATFTDPATLALFQGAGSVVFDVAATGDSSGVEDTGNVFFIFFTRASATVTVTYQFDAPDIDIEKATNGEDADTPTGPEIPAGDPVSWAYLVTNTGDFALTDVTVTDDQGVTVSCPQDTLAVAEAMTCTAEGVAVLGQYANVGSVTGVAPDGSVVTDQDPSHYLGIASVVRSAPVVQIDKGPESQSIPFGGTGTVTWDITVTNPGPVDLVNVVVDDPLAPDCDNDIGELAVGETVEYQCSLSNVGSAMTNVAMVTGEDADGALAIDEDDAQVVIVIPVTGAQTSRLAAFGALLLSVGFALVAFQRSRGRRRTR